MKTRNILFVPVLVLTAMTLPVHAQQAETPTATPAPPTQAAATAAAAATTAAAAAAAPQAAASTAPEAEIVCRMVKVTGTRLRKERVCTSNVTREQSAEWLRNQQDHGNNVGSNAVVNGGG